MNQTANNECPYSHRVHEAERCGGIRWRQTRQGPQIVAGVALLEAGNITCPPASASCCSRCSIVCNCSGPGSVDTMPGKLALGMRTPGISSLTANSLFSRQIAKKLTFHQIADKTTTAEGIAILPRVNAYYGDL